MHGLRTTPALTLVVALGSSGCQVLLGIDPDVAISVDGAARADAGRSDSADSAGSGRLDSGAFAEAAAPENFNIYIHGTFTWVDPDAYCDSPDYKNAYEPVDAQAPTGPYDIKVTLSCKDGAWGPSAPGGSFDTSPYEFLNFVLKPTVANQTWSCSLLTLDGGPPRRVNVADYKFPLDASLPPRGVWEYYSIPVSDLVAKGTAISSLVLQDTTGLATNVWYVDDVGFIKFAH